ncbi:MAG: ATP-binding cassette domain-containing protein [Candidatus Omnitrophica bacterium]|nr:ATP-binding cassette domain-containing protein [Candidatus Omnitrophota bacterium]MBD3269084.1 ATP-binding cassette domain-containing protein [Candidatus Omnitrophota bacterium]
MLEIKNVRYLYPDGTRALEDISINFPREHILALLGRSGSGKTTLLKCIGRFLKVERGKILLGGRSVYDLSEIDLRRSIGIVFQDLYLFPHLRVIDNMTLAPRLVMGEDSKQAKDTAMVTLKKLGIDDIWDKYPSQISGGQAQRVAIARALVLRPKYLLLDEPTSALDVDTTDEFGRWLVRLKEETTFIIVSHDVLFCEKTATSGALIEEGRIVSRGSIDNILKKTKR